MINRQTNYVGELLELSNKKSVHVVDVRVEAPGQVHGRVESTGLVPETRR